MKTQLTLALAACLALSSCSKKNDEDPQSEVVARYRVGGIERNFQSRQVERCALSTSARTGLPLLQVLMRDELTHSYANFRMANFQWQRAATEIIAGRQDTGDVILNIGADEKRYTYRLQQTGNQPAHLIGRCQIRYTIQNDIFQATFQCDRLLNSLGEPQSASGSFSCRFTQWKW